jgi:hypothetical protein
VNKAPQIAPNSFSDGTDLAQGHEYCFQIGNEIEWPGVILAKPGIVRWHYTTEPKTSPYSPANLLGKPHFVVSGPEGLEVLRIRRSSRFPPKFELVDQGKVVGSIALRNILRNKYQILLNDKEAWTLHMPLFTIFFRAASNSGREVLIRLGPSKRQWNLLAQPGTDTIHLLSALAFIHREWWSYN